VNAPHRPLRDAVTVNGQTPAPRYEALARNIADNLKQWILTIAPPPPARMLKPPLPAIAGTIAALIVIVLSMFFFDTTASDWARAEPSWVRDFFEKITDFGLSGWFLYPFGAAIVFLAAVISPDLSRRSREVLTMLAVRFGFLFLAIGVPGLFVTIVKRMIGRARPYVGNFDDPFSYMPFIWKSEYASMPSGHSTTAVAAAIAIGAIWPKSRAVMWLYAAVIMLSRVAVLAHHPSDVIAGALVGTAGACLVRRWFAARRLGFCPRDLRAYPGPSWQRIRTALTEAFAAFRPIERKPDAL
jgi:membrane-associated phospholipid phosphatase